MIEIIEYILIAAFGIGFIVLYTKDSRVRFISVFAMVVVLSLKSERNAFSFLEYSAAALFTGSFLFAIVKKKFIENRPFTPNPLFIFYSIFLVWGICIGAIGIGTGSINIERWYRDTLLFISPLFLLPVLYSEMIEEHRDAERILWWCVVCLWIIMFVASVVKIRNNVVEAFYAYQIGRTGYDAINGGFMVFIFLSLGMMAVTAKKRWLFLGGFLISLLSLFLTFVRTSWVSTLLFLPVVIFLGERSERKRGMRFGLLVIATILILFFSAFLLIPFVRLYSQLALQKFSSSANLGTDVSLYNRFVEWRYAFKQIMTSPITGTGFGATYWDYDWLMGVSREAGYIHNAWFAVLLRTGIVGLTLISIPCIGYFMKGLRLVKSTFLTVKEKAYLRAGIASELFVLIIGYTGSLFLQRGMVIYIAIYWCFIDNLAYKIGERKKLSEWSAL